MRVRRAFLAAHFTMAGPVILALFLNNLVPTAIWIAAAAVIVLFGREF